MPSREALLVHVAELYYEQGMSQQNIAEILGLSRPTVSRLLDEARDCGVVEITVHSPLKKDAALSARLRLELGLRDAVVLSGSYDYDKALRRCAQAAGDVFRAVLENGMTVGISWGRALRHFCTALPELEHTYNISVVQMIGCLGTGNPHLDGLELSLTLAKKLNGTFRNVYAPVYVESELVQSYLLREPSVELAIRQANQADIVISGVGSLKDKGGSLYNSGYFDDTQREQLLAAGVTAILQGRFLDRDGGEVALPGRFVVGAELDAMRRAGWRIGINATAQRGEETLAAVRSGCINVLVVDEPLALALLEWNGTPYHG